MKRTQFVRVVLAVLAVLGLFGVLPPAEAQIPRPNKAPYNTSQLRQYVTSAAFPWTITVCKGAPYGGDYSDLSEALDAIPKRFPTRGPMQRVLVLVHPCFVSSPTSFSYEETTLSVPSWTTLQGVPTGASGTVDAQSARVFLKLTGTNTTCAGCPSALLKLDTGTSLINFFVLSGTPPTGPIRLVEASGFVTLTNVVLQLTGTETHPVDLLYVTGGGVLAHNFGLTRNTFSSLSRGLVTAGSGSATINGGRIFVPSGVPVENLGTGTIRLTGVHIEPSTNVDLKRSSTGTIETFSTDYATEAGGVIDRPIRTDALTLDNACRILTGTGTPEGVVAAPVCSLFLRQDGTAATTLYVKTSGTGNTGWTAK
ncbi:MAG TPA: hypothetical protein VEL74_00245 [Thermoanaerobaculia bacterium]|nr:hypothetical protein [Thermoanaerobaculia bacterium]